MLGWLFTPRSIGQTGDDSPARSVWGYIARMTGRAQLVAMATALLVTLLNLAPIELQRRMIDDAIAEKDGGLLLTLGLLYLGVTVLHQALKFFLRLLQGWMAESAVLYTRRHLWRLHHGDDHATGEARDVTAILTAEVEKLGGFAGGGPSGAFRNASMLIGALGYMLWVSPSVAAVGLALLAPQIILTPLMQRRLNRLIEIRLRLMRRFTAAVGEGDAQGETEFERRLAHLFWSRIAFFVWKYLMKAMLNLLSALAPLGVIALGGWFVIQGEATLGVVVAFVTGFGRLGDPIRELIAFYREAAEASVRHDLIAEWMVPGLARRQAE